MKGPIVFYKWNPVTQGIDVFFLPGEVDTDLRLLYSMSVDDYIRFFFNLVTMVSAIGKNYKMVANEITPVKQAPVVKQILPPMPKPPSVPIDCPDAVGIVEDLLKEERDKGNKEKGS